MGKSILFKSLSLFGVVWCIFTNERVLANQLRASSAPYISGDTFRSFADHLFDETSQTLKPESVQYGDIIFVKGDMQGRFFSEMHHSIKNPYVLVTHNSDERMPHPFEKYLEDPKILAWFAQNIEEYSHPKLINLPIGLANRYWGHGSIEIVTQAREIGKRIPRKHLLYLNISIGNYPKERQKVFDLLNGQPFCFSTGSKPFAAYLQDLAGCKFVLSPRGNGIDCHRTWEALYMGSIPVVRTSSLDPMYEDLPVLVVNEWEEVTELFLEEKYQEIKSKQYKQERLWADYWFNEMNRWKK